MHYGIKMSSSRSTFVTHAQLLKQVIVFLSFLSYTYEIFAQRNIKQYDCTQNFSNPYYLHPNENPDMILVNPQLNDGNYPS